MFFFSFFLLASFFSIQFFLIKNKGFIIYKKSAWPIIRGVRGEKGRGSAKWWRQSQILSPGNDARDLVAPGEAEE